MSQVLAAAPSKQQVILPTSPQKVQTCSQGEQQPLKLVLILILKKLPRVFKNRLAPLLEQQEW